VIIDQPNPQQVADIIAINQLAASYSEAMCRMAVEEAGWRFARRLLLPRMMGRPDFLNGQLHDIALAT
jgi:hypothetical protein